MAYVEYHYGRYRSEIKGLLRKRLMVKERIRYHQKKGEKWKGKLPGIEKELNLLLEKAKNNVG